MNKINFENIMNGNYDKINTLVDRQAPCGNIGGYGYGDIDGDGFVTLMDYDVAKSILMGFYSPKEEEFKRADVNGDGKVDGIDVDLIKNYAHENIHTFPVCTTKSTQDNALLYTLSGLTAIGLLYYIYQKTKK